MHKNLSQRGRDSSSKRRRSFAAEGLEVRRVFAAQTPFPSPTPSVPSNTVLFVNFDVGGEGVAFHDFDKRNIGGEYRRTNIGVDIERNHDAFPTGLGTAPGVGRSVGYTRAGEYLEYTVNVAAAGVYTFQFRYASSSGGTAHLEVDGNNASGTIPLPNTGAWTNWQTLSKTGVQLTAGTHVLKFAIDSSTTGGEVGNLSWFRFTKTGEIPASVPWPDSWTRLADAPIARYEATTHVFNGKAYQFGGYKDSQFHVSREYRVFNPTTNTWTLLGTLPAGLAETHNGVADDGKYIYLVGGFSGDLKENLNPPQVGSKRVFRFDPAANKWTEMPSLPQAQGAGGAAIIGRMLHYIGGNNSDRVTNVGTHWVLNLDNPSAGWTQLKPMPIAKDHFSTVVLGGKIYTIAGEFGHDKLFDTQRSVHVYDPATDSWKRLADLPIDNSHAEGSTFAYDGQIIFAGGQTKDQQQSTDRVFAYDPAKNKWTELFHLPFYLQGAIVAVVGNKVYVTQGARFTPDAVPYTFVGTIEI